MGEIALEVGRYLGLGEKNASPGMIAHPLFCKLLRNWCVTSAGNALPLLAITVEKVTRIHSLIKLS